MKALARRIAVPALLFVAVLAGGTIVVNAFTADADELQPLAQPRAALRMQVDDELDDGGTFISDASNEDAPFGVDGVDDAVTIVPDSQLNVDAGAAVFDGAMFFDAQNFPGGPPGTLPPTP